MNIPEIIQATFPNELGAGVLILNRPPFLPIAGKIVKYNDLFSMQTALANKPPIAYSVITGFSIAILYAGIIGKGNRLIGGANALTEAQGIMDEFAQWYLLNRIAVALPRYRRYEI